MNFKRWAANEKWWTMTAISPSEAKATLATWSSESPAVWVIYGGPPTILTGWGRLDEVSVNRVIIFFKGKQTSFSGEQEITAEIAFGSSEIMSASGSSVFDAPEHLQGEMAMAFDESLQINLVSGKTLVLYKPTSASRS